MAELPTFAQWLARMAGNESAIGDLARDAAQDPNFPAQGGRIDYLNYVLALNGAGVIATFNRAWANYQTALKRAQAGQIAGKPAQDAQATALHVPAVPVDSPCQECGAGVDTLQWTIPGIGQGVLCRKCLRAVVAEINAALGA